MHSIGYVRVITGLVGLHFADRYTVFLPLYIASSLLDALDGVMARALNQATTFGAVLDMVTDRSVTSGLLLFLASVYVSAWGRLSISLFGFLIMLDISSHYMQMYISLKSGAASHKATSRDTHPFMRLYYEKRSVLFAVCAGDQLFWISLYAVRMIPEGSPLFNLFRISMLVSLPICVLKQLINIIQLAQASAILAQLDADARNK